MGQVLNPLLASGDRVPWGRLTTLIVVAGGAGALVLAFLAPRPWCTGSIPINTSRLSMTDPWTPKMVPISNRRTL